MINSRACDAPVNVAELRAVLGILSHEPRLRLRNAIRATWLVDLPRSFAARFVVRGGSDLSGTDALRDEAGRHGDVTFVRARSDLLRENGALLSLFLWLQCALTVYPAARFVGKADDDVWLQPSGWLSLLATAEARGGGGGLYIGSMEGYHWQVNDRAPVGWRNFPLSVPCRRTVDERRQPLHGPFPFAKGAVFWVSRGAAERVAGSRASSIERITANNTARCFMGSQAQIVADRPPRCSPRSDGAISIRMRYGTAASVSSTPSGVVRRALLRQGGRCGQAALPLPRAGDSIALHSIA